MPTVKLSVADGGLAVWHRFDVQNSAVTKDVHVLMCCADSEVGARDQLNEIWKKLGGSHTPPRVVYFNRRDLSLNTSSQLAAAPPAPTLSSRTTTSITINLSFNNSLGGAAPTSVTVRAVAVIGGATSTTTTNISWPWPTTANVTGLTTGTSYLVSYQFNSPFGNGTFSPTTSIATL